MNQQVRKGQAPKSIDRVDKGNPRIPGNKDHVHFKDGTAVSPSKICISLCRIPIRVIKRNRLSCVEVVRWQNTTTILFELEKCERYDISGFVSLSDYCALNCFRVIDYTVPRGQEEYVLSVLGSMYDLHFSDMSDKI